MGEKVVVMGQGYVGLPLAVAAAERGYEVVGFEVDEDRVKKLAVGESYVGDVDSAQLAALLDSGAYRPTMEPDDLAGFDLAVITVPTPMRDGLPDLSYIEAAGTTLARRLRPGAAVSLESTSYPGTTGDVLAPLLERLSGLAAGTDFHLGYSPERIDPGNTRWTFTTTPKVVAGVDERSRRRLADFYGSIVDTVVPAPTIRVAELAKVLENTFRHVNIALVNELAMHAEALGVDVWDALDIAATKPFGFMRFTPGPGVGGHCLPVDPLYLSWKVEQDLSRPFRMVALADELNTQMPEYVVRRVTRGLGRRGQTLHGARVLMLGLAYKPNTGDVRESPAVRLAEHLLAEGAQVRVADPLVSEDPGAAGLVRVELSDEEVEAAHVVLVATDHDAFDYTHLVATAGYIFDCRHRVPAADHVESL
ncbi:nucleotide sugar dehydrogenase [Streptomyces sp. NBC_01808]|uniref:nucleotide sugar dehydrogenase n=1 Tax=Streptomyces sp. NBC_01808 TaxID=2975947 RepID=UPI002DD9C53E|nr:nucleotide sugar dehydrogenase [Streptomyces sp. NBC_01808]WSA37695.1 nucleotide sugar dehydrogenase [Streptomyces sp. NBC_01808]